MDRKKCEEEDWKPRKDRNCGGPAPFSLNCEKKKANRRHEETFITSCRHGAGDHRKRQDRVVVRIKVLQEKQGQEQVERVLHPQSANHEERREQNNCD